MNVFRLLMEGMKCFLVWEDFKGFKRRGYGGDLFGKRI
jgi:hypothetical protein